jgi:hypothetical protein
MKKLDENPKFELFLVNLRAKVPWDDLPNRGLFAIYDTFPGPPWMCRPIYIGAGEVGLRHAIHALSLQKRIHRPPHVVVCTAASERDLPDPAYQAAIRQVLDGIALVKERGDTETLLKFRSALERKGTRPGVAADPENKRWLINLLADLASGKRSLKESVPRPWKPSSASARLSRFCWDFYVQCVLFGAHDLRGWKDPFMANVLKNEFGFCFLDERFARHDSIAAREAYRRGKRQVREIDRPNRRIAPRGIS